MEFKGFKIDFTALAVLVTAISTAVMAIKGSMLKKKKKEEDTNG